MRAAVFDCITQRFLNDPEQAKRHFFGQHTLASFFSKCDLDLMMRAQFIAQTLHTGNET